MRSFQSFPLSAIVGQDSLVEALLINAVAPDVGGVLVRGQRGTAKSTAVRGLAPLLAGLDDGAVPLVEVPLGATLDRLVGSLDLRRALDGEHEFEPGLLARAHGGILYVDEVNLLPDHLVDALLDAAASGVARVERDAVSVEHEARFMLVGTMNVEEGDLRPQLLDRFGLGAEVRAPEDPVVRAEIVQRRLAFEHDPERFAARFEPAERDLAGRIVRARQRLDGVHLPQRELLRITGACARLNIDGMRGDIVWAHAARALAALDDAEEVEQSHVRRAGPLALVHRRRRDPLDGSTAGDQDLERALESGDEEPDPPEGPPPRGRRDSDGAGASSSDKDGTAPAQAPARERRDPPAPARERRDPPAPARLPLGAFSLERPGRGPRGRRARAAGPEAGAIDSRPATADGHDIAIVPTLRARLLRVPGERSCEEPLREHVRAGREGLLLCLVVDASGSMGARRRLARVKGALLDLLRDAYARRDRVAIVAFRDRGARVVVSPGTPLERAASAVRELPTGGRTPLTAGLELAEVLLRRDAAREPSRRAIAVVLTDGRVADPDGAARSAVARLAGSAAAVHVVDTEDGAVRLGLAAALAAAASGQLHTLRPQPTRRAA